MTTRGKIIGIGLLLVAVAIGLVLGLREPAVQFVGEVISILRDAGPLLFFIAMAILPAVGFPLSPFAVAAGPVFGPVMGTGPVVLCAIAAITVNVSLSYWLAFGLLRGRTLRLLDRLAPKYPILKGTPSWRVVMIVRLAPGLPFFMQSYLLGALRTPFLTYMLLSTAIPAAYLSGVIIFGEAVWHGRAGMAFLGISVAVVAGLGFQLWGRRHGPSLPG